MPKRWGRSTYQERLPRGIREAVRQRCAVDSSAVWTFVAEVLPWPSGPSPLSWWPGPSSRPFWMCPLSPGPSRDREQAQELPQQCQRPLSRPWRDSCLRFLFFFAPSWMTSLADLVHSVLLSDSRTRLSSWQVFLRRQLDRTPERGQSAMREACRRHCSNKTEPARGFEPPTRGLRNRCSTTELRWLFGP